MPKKFIKKISSILLIVIITSTHSSIKPDWLNDLSDNTPALYIAATAAACVIGKLSYGFYREYTWPNRRIIEHCRTTYATIYNDIKTCYNTYRSDSQSSDWDLKEAITHTKISYPFIAYNKQIVLKLFKLIKHNLTIADELKRINKRKKQLINNNSEESILLIEEFMQLEAKGRFLQQYITKTCAMLSSLKNKVALFKEYEDDFHNWSCEKQKKQNSLKQSLKYLQNRLFLL
jgi:hypothetical protein